MWLRDFFLFELGFCNSEYDPRADHQDRVYARFRFGESAWIQRIGPYDGGCGFGGFYRDLRPRHKAVATVAGTALGETPRGPCHLDHGSTTGGDLSCILQCQAILGDVDHSRGSIDDVPRSINGIQNLTRTPQVRGSHRSSGDNRFRSDASRKSGAVVTYVRLRIHSN